MKKIRGFFAFCLSLLFFAAVATLFAPQAAAGLYDQDGNTVWRHGAKHEGGDIEENELTYVVFNNNYLLEYFNVEDTITVYQIIHKDSSSFSAKPVEAYSIETRKDAYGVPTPHAVKAPLENDKPINVTVSNNTLRVEGWEIILKKTDGWCTNFVPEELHKYLSKAQLLHE